MEITLHIIVYICVFIPVNIEVSFLIILLLKFRQMLLFLPAK